MKSAQLFRLAGWSAYVSVAAMVAGAIIVTIMDTGDTGLLTKLENLTTIILALAMLLLALALHQLYRKTWSGLVLAATLLGVIAMLTAAGAKFLIFIDAISPEGVADVLDDLAFALIGGWLVIVGYLGWLSRKPSASLAGVAVIAGVGQVLVTIGFLISEPPAFWSLMGGGVTIVAYPIWAISMGRWLLRQSSTNQIAESVIVS